MRRCGTSRWTKKHGKRFFGYKHHVCVDVKRKLVRGYATTAAKDGDVTVMLALVDPTQKGECLFADAAYRAKEEGKALRTEGVKSRVMFKRSKGKDLTSHQKRENRKGAKTRACVEHAFGSMQNETGEKFMRTIGKPRASIQIGLLNLQSNVSLPNVQRFVCLESESACKMGLLGRIASRQRGKVKMDR